MDPRDELPEKAEKLRIKLVNLPRRNKELRRELESLAVKLDEINQNVAKSMVSGATTSIVGGTLSIVGFGLSFVTFGASLGLNIAGGVVGGAGGVVMAGATIGDAIDTKKKVNEAKAKFDEYDQLLEDLEKCRKEIETILDVLSRDDTDENSSCQLIRKLWNHFWSKITRGSATGLMGLGLNILLTSITSGLKIAGETADDVLAVGVKIASKTAYRSLSTAGKAFHFISGIGSCVFLPLDIYYLVDSSITIHKNSPHKESVKIRKVIKILADSLPTADEIEELVQIIGLEYSRH